MRRDPSSRLLLPFLPCTHLGGARGPSRGHREGGCSSSGTPKRSSGWGGGPGLPGCLPGAVSWPPAALRGREQFADFACTTPGTGQTDPQPDPNPGPGCATTGSGDSTVCLSLRTVRMTGMWLVLCPFAAGSHPSLPSTSGAGGAGGRWVPARGSQVLDPLPPIPGVALLPASPRPRGNVGHCVPHLGTGTRAWRDLGPLTPPAPGPRAPLRPSRPHPKTPLPG